MQLDRLQAAFAAALIEPDAVGEVAAALVGADARVRERFALYRGNVSAVWEKALAHAFPVTHALVGEEFFRLLARAYAQAHPSASGDLNEFGIHFANFVAQFEAVRPLPYLAEVAALEWAVHRAHYAADADAVEPDHIARLAPEELLAARFVLHPALAWFDSRYPIVGIWNAHQPRGGAPLPQSLDRAECALVVRLHWRVAVQASSAAEIAALTQLREGAALGSAIEAALAVDAGFDASQALLRWVDFAVLAGPVLIA